MSHETVQPLVDQLSGLILGANQTRVESFNDCSVDIWGQLAEFVCNGQISLGLTFGRTRRPSDHHTLPSYQINTTLFPLHQDPSQQIEVKSGVALGITEAPRLTEDTFVFTLSFPSEPYIAAIRWSLHYPRPKVVHSIVPASPLE